MTTSRGSTVTKRQKERTREERRQKKAERRAQRKGERANRPAGEAGVDPDLVGIEPLDAPLVNED